MELTKVNLGLFGIIHGSCQLALFFMGKGQKSQRNCNSMLVVVLLGIGIGILGICGNGLFLV